METRCLTREERLRLKRDFDAVFQEGKSVANEYLRIVYRKNGKALTRIGVVIKKKIGKAVYRNRLRRLIKEVFRNNKREFPKGYDLVFIVKEGLRDWKEIKYQDMLKIVLELVKRLR